MTSVPVTNAHPRYRINKELIGRYVVRVMRGGKKNGVVSVVFVNAVSMRRINRKYLGHSSDTDVITFPLGEGPDLEGEIYVNLDRARKQADEVNVQFGEEVARLVIHGALHLIGYDDTTRDAAAVMKRTEDGHVRHWFSHKRKG